MRCESLAHVLQTPAVICLQHRVREAGTISLPRPMTIAVPAQRQLATHDLDGRNPLDMAVSGKENKGGTDIQQTGRASHGGGALGSGQMARSEGVIGCWSHNRMPFLVFV